MVQVWLGVLPSPGVSSLLLLVGILLLGLLSLVIGLRAVQGDDRWRARLLFVFVSVALTVLACGLLAFNSHPGGDTSGEEFNKIAQIRVAVPASSVDVTVSSQSSVWTGGCKVPSTPAGWTSESYIVSFSNSSGEMAVTTQVNQVLRAQGWVRHDVPPGPHYGLLPHWRLAGQEGHDASAFLYTAPHGSSHWGLSASFQPPGPQGWECP